mgnify:CR=1 FL=1
MCLCHLRRWCLCRSSSRPHDKRCYHRYWIAWTLFRSRSREPIVDPFATLRRLYVKCIRASWCSQSTQGNYWCRPYLRGQIRRQVLPVANLCLRYWQWLLWVQILGLWRVWLRRSLRIAASSSRFSQLTLPGTFLIKKSLILLGTIITLLVII